MILENSYQNRNINLSLRKFVIWNSFLDYFILFNSAIIINYHVKIHVYGKTLWKLEIPFEARDWSIEACVKLSQHMDTIIAYNNIDGIHFENLLMNGIRVIWLLEILLYRGLLGVITRPLSLDTTTWYIYFLSEFLKLAPDARS